MTTFFISIIIILTTYETVSGVHVPARVSRFIADSLRNTTFLRHIYNHKEFLSGRFCHYFTNTGRTYWGECPNRASNAAICSAQGKEREHMGQKDLAAKDLESRPEVFADIINALIYEGEQVVSPEQLQPAPTETLYESVAGEPNGESGEKAYRQLHNQYNDVSKYEIEKQRIKIQYVLENESGENYRLILRKAGYEGAVYRGEYDGNQIYPVVILVLYWGGKNWKPPHGLHELFRDRLTDVAVRKYVDNIRLHVFPMAHLPEGIRRRFRSDMRIIVDYLAEGVSYEPTEQVIKYIGPTMRLLYAITGEKEVLDMIADMQCRQEKGEEVRMGEYYITKCVRQGRQQGIQEGIQQGMDLIRILLDSGRNEDVKRSAEDKEYREKLLREFNL